MKTGREKTELLKNLSGEFRAGELTAIMGLSGAGKSTLMDVLTGFTTTGVTGNIMVNSKARNLNEFRRLLAYIMQNDNLQPLLTVQEAMNVAADLKLTTSPQQKKQKIDQILVTMSLDTCRHTRTGKLSGGERKRLAIALELINSPPILFLDEPTSGLDSVTSKYCITLLKQLAKAGQTVICSIHQPSASLLNMIDHLYVVADGNCVYSGSTQNLVPYLSSLGLQCPTHYNPADYLMEICNGDYGRYLPQMVNAIENGKNNAWRSISNVTNVNHQEEVIALNVTASFQALRQRSPMEIQHVYGKHKAGAGCAIGFWKQLFILLKRNAIRLSRDKVLTFTRLSMHFVIALIVGVIYFKIGQDAVYVLDNFNLLFFNIMFLMFSAFSATVTTFPSELPITMREHFNRWYKLHSFYLANKLADIPIQFTAISLYILIVYYMSDQLLELQRFCLYTLMCFAVSMVAQTFGLLVGTGMKVQHGMIFGPLMILPFLIFSGFFVQFRDAHPYLRWLFHLSFLKYGFEGVMIAIYGYDRPKLSCSDVYCHFAIPETLLNAVDMKQANYWFCLIVLVALYIALDIGTYTLLKYKLEKRV
ncbi:ATP-binding cassette sub-family G member 1-like isoform X2 [Bombus vosnesenskii]|uniref:ATP-binding cassette sub-family G member 1-like isoform X2 n=3 Tax=Pyrobombus TaxID=144703 RepID=A0A6J3KBB2_9HYME|nr:ATP-binding cassette sub-family G member 1-like isoform X2 [Bombus vancouverensis nearcticus]XP_033306467.1 ATP-binding cassette sub-family G member 1-like isoform X2 [Bombus bifarius]XP_033350408.1 ATP-binding cassette sub-family G member 1-like isoform X2 [Bombus vosnesenskii]